MQVNFYATLRPLVGGKTVHLAWSDGTTLRALLETLFADHPALRPELLDDQGQLHGYVHVFVNGRDGHYLERVLDTPLAPTDKVDIFPAVGGG